MDDPYTRMKEWYLRSQCEYCGALPGSKCTTRPGNHELTYPHSVRYSTSGRYVAEGVEPADTTPTTELEHDPRTCGGCSAHKNQTVVGPYNAQVHAGFLQIVGVKARTGGQVTIATVPYRAGTDPLYLMPEDQARTVADLIVGFFNSHRISLRDRR